MTQSTETIHWTIITIKSGSYANGETRYVHALKKDEPCAFPWAAKYSTSITPDYSFTYLLKYSGWVETAKP